MVCVSEAETARREKGVRCRTKKKRSGKIYITGERKKKSRVSFPLDRVKWVPVKVGGAKPDPYRLIAIPNYNRGKYKRLRRKVRLRLGAPSCLVDTVKK